ncbi:MAG: 50S ribosomal protein L9 [Candidatus Liptonbacteria bacterium]|nr:50S ribosomal protein L9 [Candidatus Liptonbacteria bacterium]
MKIILLVDVRNIGKKYDVKEVSDGYARNFLFPNQLAEAATPSAIKKLEAFKARLDKDEAKLKKHLEELAQKINGTSIEFRLKADKSGSVFGSVTKEMILKSLREQKLINKERVEIKLDHPIKALGDHKIAVDLKKGIEAILGVRVLPQE